MFQKKFYFTTLGKCIVKFYRVIGRKVNLLIVYKISKIEGLGEKREKSLLAYCSKISSFCHMNPALKIKLTSNIDIYFRIYVLISCSSTMRGTEKTSKYMYIKNTVISLDRYAPIQTSISNYQEKRLQIFVSWMFSSNKLKQLFYNPK